VAVAPQAQASGCGSGPAEAITVGRYIMVDQLGYRPDMPKVAVLVDPQLGHNAADTYAPGATLQLRRWDDAGIVLSAASTPWSGGQTQASSGDRGWWFDFSSVTTPGSYYVYDPDNELRSHCFEVRDDVYRPALVAATRMFFYNRCGFAKQEPHADARWTDAAAYLGPGQDTEARFVDDKGNALLARDMSGGWFDAGDTNKYTTFAAKPVHQLLCAYAQNPGAFTDDFGIPESGNGIPDLLDEVRWELDWLVRMQNQDGGAHIKIGAIQYVSASPPSSDAIPRYYAPVCSSATISVAGMFAHAALVLRDFPSLAGYAGELQSRAVSAWQWYHANPLRTDCDTQEIKSGDADQSEAKQQQLAVVAAIYLYALTGDSQYDSHVIAHYRITRPYQDNGWSRYDAEEGDALLFYTTLPGADPGVRAALLEKKVEEATTQADIYRFDPSRDLYRAYITDATYHWGSNQARCDNGNTNYDMIHFGLDAEHHAEYYARAAGILNYIHGVNPFGMVYLSNMYGYGAELSANEIYHAWFCDGSIWDNAVMSANGPAPGYVPGGPNASYSGDSAPPAGQPLQKCYLDWNGSAWSETYKDKSWEITEPAVYYQSAYVKLVSSLVR
jgi:hypothetical protein